MKRRILPELMVPLIDTAIPYAIVEKAGGEPSMKVQYPLKKEADLKELKAFLKPFGGRCAKVIDGTLEYQIKEENEKAAYEALKEKGFVD
ncbi:hypothetical protein [Caldibacillus debilis]|nr:hypothetical protein [Caldibacillus debilis]